MAPSKNAELIVPYVHHPAKRRTDASSTISQTLPMAAMFLRNKVLSWSAVFIAVQSYLNEPTNPGPRSSDDTSQPPLLRIAFSFISLATCYLELIFPGTAPRPGVKAAITETAASIVASATGSA